MSVTSLVTRGYICYPQRIGVPQPASLDTPEIVGALEMKPEIRSIESPDTSGDLVPRIISVEEED